MSRIKTAVETDGYSHNNKFNYDICRPTKLQHFAIQFIRFDDMDVKENMEGVLSAPTSRINGIVLQEK